jgi:phospholipase C
MLKLKLALLLIPIAAMAAHPDGDTATPIEHVVVIFGENISFDHYFATYPNATNPAGEPVFKASPGTPTINGLTPALLQHNPNSTNPFRLDPSMALTCDNDNHYTDEQKAYHGGLLDKFPENTAATGAGCTPALSMGYYDGNTVTALWNYAQHFALSDNFFDSEFGTTVMGHLNLISGQTHTASVTSIHGKVANGSVIANVEAGVDDCVTSATGTPVTMTGLNVGDLLNQRGVSWGWFYADFPQSTNGQPLPLASCPSTYNAELDFCHRHLVRSSQSSIRAGGFLERGPSRKSPRGVLPEGIQAADRPSQRFHSPPGANLPGQHHQRPDAVARVEEHGNSSDL